MDKSPNFYAEQFASAAWGPWLIFLLIGSGIFFLIYSRFEIFKYLLHAFRILFSKEKTFTFPSSKLNTDTSSIFSRVA